ncbi:putative non-specific serine/threonine protein kinase [Rosa chinensis]|uniref:Putative non-specific serine/threonine protein kinase n=1 Tax=Rosa chinensis TaxID=74649 RepID=A0A2P6SKL2_ROSCH|nr:putative non-specific serine/threonine protein kinase [Rosa chinensis]
MNLSTTHVVQTGTCSSSPPTIVSLLNELQCSQLRSEAVTCGGIRTSVKGYLIAKRLSLTGEIDTVHEMNEIINTNFTALQAHNVPSTPQTEGEILLKRFLFNELKIATWNFHPDNMVGVGGFGYVFKGWVDGNSSTAAKTGSGMLIAVKTIDQEGFQGQEEWLVSFTCILDLLTCTFTISY